MSPLLSFFSVSSSHFTFLRLKSAVSSLGTLSRTSSISKKSQSCDQVAQETFCERVARDIGDVHKTLTRNVTIKARRGSRLDELGGKFEHFLSDLDHGIDKVPKARGVFQDLAEKHRSIIGNWQASEPRVWKEDLDGVPGADASRRKISEAVVGVVEEVTKEAGIAPAFHGLIGTNSPKSDLDIIAHVDRFRPNAEKTVLSDNADLGVKSSLAYLIWLTKFRGAATDQADIQFMPSQVAQYFKEKAQSSILARARLTALWLQGNQSMPSEQIARFNALLMSDLEKRGEGQARIQLEGILADIKSFEEALAKILKTVPEKYRELPLNVFAYQVSMKMKLLAGKIESLPAGEERELLAAHFYFLSVLRARFLPGAYFSKGAFTVVCENAGSQLAQRKDEAWDRRFTEEGQKEVEALLKQIMLLGKEEITRNQPVEDQFQLTFNKFLSTLKDKPFLQEELHQMSLEFVELVKKGKLLRDHRLTMELLFNAFANRCRILLLVESKQLKQNDPSDLLESAVENGFCYCHSHSQAGDKHEDRAELIHNAKYGKRFFDGAYQFLDSLEQSFTGLVRQSYINDVMQSGVSVSCKKMVESLKGKSLADQDVILAQFIAQLSTDEHELRLSLELLLSSNKKQFLEHVMGQLDEKQNAFYKEIITLQDEFRAWMEKMSVLEAAKRTKWDRASFSKTLEQITIKERNSLKQLKSQLKEHKASILKNKDLNKCVAAFVRETAKFYQLDDGSHVVGLSMRDLLPHSFNSKLPKSKLEKLIKSKDPEAKEKLWKELMAKLDNVIVSSKDREKQIEAFVERNFDTAQIGSDEFLPMDNEVRVETFLADLVNKHLCLGIVDGKGVPTIHHAAVQGIAQSIARIPGKEAVASASEQKQFAHKLIRREALTVQGMQQTVLEYSAKLMGLAVQSEIFPVPSLNELAGNVSLTKDFLEMFDSRQG